MQATRRRSLSSQAAVAAGTSERAIVAQPFVKWVGGKSQLLAQFESLFPREIVRYAEPFVGGGAVFFHLKRRFPRMRAKLCDNNAELINAYRVVRDFPRELMARLDDHLSRFLAGRRDYYYAVRARETPAEETIERAARMIFLNKTCFNGLWRVNGGGRFNVPLGWQKNPSLYDERNLLVASVALRDAELTTQDFRATLREAQPGDFVYVDPPYVPVSPTAKFTSYTKEDFGPREQEELALAFAEAAQRGVRLMLSNSDTPRVRELYRDFEVHSVSARRTINRDAGKRGAIGEVVVRAIREVKALARDGRDLPATVDSARSGL